MKCFITAPNRTDLYWRPNKEGYTTNLADAGLYDWRESTNIEKEGRGDKVVILRSKKEEIQSLIKEHQRCIDKLTWMETQYRR